MFVATARKFGFVSMFVAALVVFLSAHPALALTGTETQITKDSLGQYSPVISGSKIVWIDQRDHGNSIYMYDVATQVETAIDLSVSHKYSVDISGNKIVWSSVAYGSNYTDIRVYDLVTQTAFTIATGPSLIVGAPRISGNKIVWSQYPDTYVYDLDTQIKTRVSEFHYQPAISGDNIVWFNNWSDGTGWHNNVQVFNLTTRLTITIPDAYTTAVPVISGDRVVWEDNQNGYGSIYLYDLKTQLKTRITTNFGQHLPDISGDKIVWMDNRNDSNNNGNWDIYMYDMKTSTESQITNNPTEQSAPRISGNRIVWQDLRNNPNGINYNIYMYEFDATPVNVPPVAQITPVPITILGHPTTFDGSVSSDSDGTIASYHWDFGDGTSGDGVTANHTYVSAGTYQVTLTVTDNAGAVATATATARVDAPPVARIAPVPTVILGETAAFDGSASSDSDGTVVIYQWNFGDNASGSGSQATHTYSASGTFQVTLTVTDDAGATGAVAVTTLVQTPAQAINDLISLVQSMNLSRGIANSLDSKLQNASAALSAANAGNRSDAVNKLQSFINAAQAQSGNQLTVVQANQLIDVANRIISVIR